MILLCSIGSLEDWQLGWLRRKESVPTALTGPMKRAFILNFGTKFFTSWTKRHLVSKDKLLQSNMSGKGPNIYGKVLTTDTKCPSLRLHLEPLWAPPMKVKCQNFGAIAMMGQNLQMVMSASQSTLTPYPRICTPSSQFPQLQRMDHPHPGAAGNSCFMCNEMAHFLNHCPVLLE